MGTKQKESVQGLGMYFAENTSMHGVGRIVGKPGVLRRLFWTLAVLGGAGVAAYNIHKVIVSYISWEVSTVITLEYNSLLTFPAVTVCNLNPARRSKLQEVQEGNNYGSESAENINEERETTTASGLTDTAGGLTDTAGGLTDTAGGLTDAVGGLTDTAGGPTDTAGGLTDAVGGLTDTVGGLTDTVGGLTDALKNTTKGDTWRFLNRDFDFPDWNTLVYDDDYFDTYDEDYSARVEFDRTFSSLRREEQIAIGHNLSDMMMDCSFQGYPCTPKNFTLSHNYMYGNCYTFNPSEADKGTITKSGPLHGFVLSLYAEEYEYESSLADSVGFKVVVHSPSKMPFPDNEGFDIAPGMATSVGVTKIEIERASAPYGKCVRYDKDSELPFNIFDNELPNLGYSDKACETSCFQELLLKGCECCSSKYPCTDSIIRNFTNMEPEAVQFCNFHTKEDTCAKDVMSKFEKLQSGCHERCLANCFDDSHQLEISSARWPASGRVESIASAIIERAETKGVQLPINESSTIDEKKTFIRENVLKLNVYYKQLNYERIETRPAYDWSGLLSDLGGQAGLWLGFSLLTLGEILELLVDVIVTCFRKCCCCSPQQVNPVAPKPTKW